MLSLSLFVFINQGKSDFKNDKFLTTIRTTSDDSYIKFRVYYWEQTRSQGRQDVYYSSACTSKFKVED